MIIPIEFIVGCILLLLGVLFTAYPREKTYLTRLINMEVAEFGLVFIMLTRLRLPWTGISPSTEDDGSTRVSIFTA